MSKFRNLAAAAAVVAAVGCGGELERVPDEGGGADGFADRRAEAPAEPTSGPAGGMMRLSEAERQFVQQASQSNEMEVTLGEMAEDKAQNDQVKQLGEKIASDHAAAQRQLQASIGGGDATDAQRVAGGTQPGQGGAEAEQMQQKLEKLSGAQFDRAYLDMMVQHHQRDIQQFEQQLQQTDNAQLRQFIDQTLPTLREHLQRSQQLQKTIR